MADAFPSSEIVHGTTVGVDGRAALIIGPSGSGKSSLALQLIALGAALVSDDRTVLTVDDEGRVVATAPDTIVGMIEARGVGLLKVDQVQPVAVCLVIDLSHEEPDRLPPARSHELLGVTIPCLLRAPGPHFPASVLLCLKGSLPLRT